MNLARPRREVRASGMPPTDNTHHDNISLRSRIWVILHMISNMRPHYPPTAPFIQVERDITYMSCKDAATKAMTDAQKKYKVRNYCWPTFLSLFPRSSSRRQIGIKIKVRGNDPLPLTKCTLCPSTRAYSAHYRTPSASRISRQCVRQWMDISDAHIPQSQPLAEMRHGDLCQR